MPEEERTAAPAPLPESGEMDPLHRFLRTERTGKERLASLRWVIVIGAAGAVGALAFNIVLYFQTGAWQMLGVAAGSAGACACLIPAWRLGRRGQFDFAAYWVLGGMLLALAAGELLHEGLTLYLVTGGILLTLFVGNLILPHKRQVWVGATLLFAALAALVNWLAPLPRYRMQQLGALSDIFAAGLIAFLVIAALFAIIRAYRQIATIRTRLTVSFVMVALMPVLAIAAALVTFGLGTTSQQIVDRLEPVAVLKQAEIEYWANDLQIDLEIALSGQQLVPNLRALDLEPAGSEAYQTAAQNLREHLTQVLEQTQRHEELFLMNIQGQVVVSTDATQEGQTFGNQQYFREGLNGLYVQPPRYSVTTMRATLTIARPVVDEQSQTLGVLAGRASLASLDALMAEQTGLGETGETYLVANNHTLLTPSKFSRVNVGTYSDGVDDAVDNKRNGSGFYESWGRPVVGAYRWLPDLQMALVAEQEQAEALSAVLTTLVLVAGITLAGILAAIGVALLVTRSIALPLGSLTETTAQVASGDLSLTAEVRRKDEIGILAQTFNAMTDRLRGMIDSLEDRVAERTRELEHRSAYLEASAEVGRVASAVLDPNQLANQVVDLIRARFDLYYVGLFLMDEAKEWAVLQAGTGPAGQAMLSRGHRIRVGEGMIGWSVANNRWRVALEAEEDAVRLVTPELPETRSEAAFPLHSRDRMLGALTVQDSRPGAFDQEAVVALQIMADQVAVALDNARLYMQAQESLEAERRAYGEISREAWQQIVRSGAILGYRSTGQGVLEVDATAAASGDGKTVAAIPIPIRGQIVGTLHFRKGTDGAEWNRDEIAVLQTMAEQLGLALDSARLYQETQRRAAREQLIGEIASRVRETLDVETMLKTTAQEVRHALGLPEVVVRLTGQPTGRPNNGEQSDGH